MNKHAKYFIAVDSVDGQTSHTFISDHRSEVFRFLEKYDHEGSSVTLRVELNDPKEIYNVLSGESI